jgi:hypothetical protein
MAAKPGSSLIYQIQESNKPNTVDVKEVGSSPAIGSSYANLAPIVVKGKTYLLGYNSNADHLDIFEFSAASPWLKAVSAKPSIKTGLSIIEPFMIGNRSDIAGYEPKKGIFYLYSVADDLSLSKTPYEFFRNHEPSLTQGFATLKSFTSFGQVVFLGYNFSNGYVAMYTLSVTATSPPDSPPLLLTPTWAHNWAKGWTRFAFFQLGGENFFLKTNTDKPNVNIDHIMDGLSAGTAEVGTNLDLKDAQKLSLVQAFYLGNGDPYFVTYKNDGTLTFFRFHSDCLGWTQVASLSSKSNATQMVPLAVGGKQYLVIH